MAKAAVMEAAIKKMSYQDLRLPDPLKTVATKPGFRYRWVQEDRVPAIETAGYFTTDEMGTDAPKTFVRKKDGPVRAGNLVLMAVPEAIHKARQDAKEGEAQRRTGSLKSETEQLTSNIRKRTGMKFGVVGDGMTEARSQEE